MARILTACLLTTVGSVLPLFLTGALGVQVQAELGLSNAGFGAVVTTHHLSGMLLGIVLGRRIDTIGWPRAVALSSVVAAASLLGIAVLARSPVVLAAFLALGGVAHASAMASVNLAIVEEIPRRRHGVVFGLKQAAPTAGFLLAGLSLPWVALTLGWRWAYVLAAGMTLGAGAVVPTDRRAPRRPRPLVAPATTADRTGRAVLMPATRRLAVAGGFAATSVSALASFLVISNVAAGLAPAAAGMLVAACSVVGIVTRVVVGAMTDRRGSNGLRLVAIMLFLGCIGYAFLATGQRSLVVVGSLVAFGAGWGWPGLFHFAVVSINREAPAAATGLVHSAISAGSAVGPVAFGLIAEQFSYGPAWTMVALAAFVGGSLILTARPALIAPKAPGEVAVSPSAAAT